MRIRQAELAKEAAYKEAEQQEAAAKAEEARLNATRVQEANAERDVALAAAEGAAASVLEDGKARAAAIELIGQAVQKHPEALKVMLVEALPSVVSEVSKSVSNISLGKVTVIDGGKGDAIAGAAMGRARALTETLATLETVLGIDFKQLTGDIAKNIGKSNNRDATPKLNDAGV